MRRGIIHLNQMHLMGILGGKLLQKRLKTVTIQMGKFQHKRVATARFHQTIEPAIAKLSLSEPHGLNAKSSEFASLHTQESHSTLITGPVAHPPMRVLSPYRCQHLLH